MVKKSTRPKRPQKFDERYWDSTYQIFNRRLFVRELKDWDDWAERNPYEGPRDFKVIRSISSSYIGTTSKRIRLVLCPNCGEDFPQEVREGCFVRNVFPMSCPYCGYPFRSRVR